MQVSNATLAIHVNLNGKMEDIRIFAVYLPQRGLLCRLLAAYLPSEGD